MGRSTKRAVRGRRTRPATPSAAPPPNNVTPIDAPRGASRGVVGAAPQRPSLLRTLGSLLVDRLQSAARIGYTFDRARDLYATLGYERTLTYKHYQERYQRGGVAERIIEAYPFATWAGGARLLERDTQPDAETPFERESRLLFSRLDIWNHLLRADVLAQLGHYSVLYIAGPGDPATPLPSTLDADSLLYLRPYSEDTASVKTYVKDTAGPEAARYGLPDTYTITFRVSPTETKDRIVHHSRLIHIAEGTLENDYYGKPRLRAVWNYLDDLDKIIGGGAEAAWKRMDPGMQVDIDPELEMDEDEEDALDAEIEEYQHKLRRVMRTRGAKINLLASQVQGFGPNADAVIQLISATTGIPHRILTGSERGELASTQDRFNWSDRINERRRGYAELIVRRLVDRLINYGALPAPTSKSFDAYRVSWPEIGELSTVAKAEIANKYAAANQAMYVAGLPPVITNDEIRTHVLGLPVMTEDQIPEPPPVPTPSNSDDDRGTPGDRNTPNAPTDGADAGT